MSNLYDKAHELAHLIEKDESYSKVSELSQKIMEQPNQMQKLDQFRREQFELQRKQMSGVNLEENELEKVNHLYEELIKDSDVKALLEHEERLSRLFADLNRILTEPLEKIYKK